MAIHTVVVVGTSAGGIEALRSLAAGLPSDFALPICIVIHTSPESPGVLPLILNRAGPLHAAMAANGERLQPGRIYVAPADHHLLIEPGVARLTKGPKENRFRPAIDPLFRSAAQVYGPAAIAVLLTGSLDDGTAGLRVVKQLGGVTIVQDPTDALFPSMPESALRHVRVDYCMALSDIAPLLARLAATPAEARARTAVPCDVAIEVSIAKEENPVDAGIEQIGEPSSFACPDCHGVLLRMKGEHPLRFRCHTGHAFSAQSLVAATNEGIEWALWSAVRSLEEASLLMHHVSAHAREEGDSARAEALDAEAQEARRQAEAVRLVVTQRGVPTPAKP